MMLKSVLRPWRVAGQREIQDSADQLPEGLQEQPVTSEDRTDDGTVAVSSMSAPAAETGEGQTEGPLAGDTIDLKLLVITAERSEPACTAISAILDTLGLSYDIFDAVEERLEPGHLSGGNHSFYQGVILSTGNLSYLDAGSNWTSGFDDEEWQVLWRYEKRFGIRQVAWYCLPGGLPDSCGLALAAAVDVTSAPLAVIPTEAGREIFWYLNPAQPVALRSTWVYLANVLDPAVTPLLVTDDGLAVGAIHRNPDGRENLVLTMAHAPDLEHTLLLGYGLINWVCRGLFVGERHVYLNPQVDDIFTNDNLWNPETLTTDSERPYRIDCGDVDGAAAWLDRLHREERNARALELELAFNGAPATVKDDALVNCLQAKQGRFRWVSHGFTHLVVDHTPYETCLSEIQLNDELARDLGLHKYDPDSLVTPELSGLKNADFMAAAQDAGIRFMVSDTSRPEWANPAPNVGVTSDLARQVTIIPRHPNNLFFNVTTPDEWVSEYNQIYRNFWQRDLSFDEIVDQEAGTILQYLLRFDMDPVMFHQSNLHLYDGQHSLLSDLLDRVLAKYNALCGDLPILSVSLHEIGTAMARRSAWRDAGVQATLIRDQGLVLRAEREVTVPITGAALESASESYGGQQISWHQVPAGTLTMVPIRDLVGYEPPTPAGRDGEA